MAGVVPTEVFQYTGSRDEKLHKKVVSSLTQAGHPATRKSVNPDDQSMLEGIRDQIGGMARVTGDTWEENFRGANSKTYVVTSAGKLPIQIALKRFLKKAA